MEFLNRGNTVGTAIPGAFAHPEVTQPPQSIVGAIYGDIGNMQMLASDTLAELCSLSDRLFGAVPRVASGAGQNAAKPSGELAALNEAMMSLTEYLGQVREEARKLNGRL